VALASGGRSAFVLAVHVDPAQALGDRPAVQRAPDLASAPAGTGRPPAPRRGLDHDQRGVGADQRGQVLQLAHGIEHAPVEEILAASTALADGCLQLALDALEAEMGAALRRGPRREWRPQRLVVFALGKLGGGELNFSSDIDIVYGYEHDGRK
jgi:hypothetical protein